MTGGAAAGALIALGALADPTRRRVFERLLSGPLAVHEIADGMPVTRPAVSQHLRVLGDAGLVTARSAGTRRIYAVDPKGMGALRTWMDEFWGRALEGYRAAAEEAAED
ncbi:MAG TPA: metalloregulator ArsR/SmtB family transcription factor [Candidatus Limnocylindria bacterium]|nr:metalloregulator ArsR/SmtB family transcription factor [Candidatus Limnocylindria bacterium]